MVVYNLQNFLFLIQETIGKSSPLKFSPSIETIKENAFLPDHPKNLFKTAEQMPLLAGLNDKEGRLVFSGVYNRNYCGYKLLSDSSLSQ